MSGASSAPADYQAPPPLKGPKLILTAIMVALTGFMVVLDTTVCNVAIPTLAAGLGVSPHEATWVITSYAVADAITVPLAGWLAMRFGPAATVAAGMAIFGISSAVCGFSTSLPMLVTARIAQGLAGGPLMPLTQTMMLSIFPKEKAGLAMAIWTMTSTAGPVIGAFLGGYICEYWSWEWIFLINVPVAMVLTILLWRTMRDREPPTQKRPVDVTGFLLMALWIGAFQMALDRGHDLDWFESPIIIGLVIVAVIGFISFLMWELTDDHPVVNLRIFRYRGFAIGAMITSIGFAVFFGSVLLSPLWLQTAMGYTQTWAAYTSVFTAGVGMVAMPFVAMVMNRIDTRPMIFCGLLIMSAAYVWRGQFNNDATFGLVILSQAFIGVGMSFVFAPALGIALGSVKPQEIASAAGLLAFVRTASMAFSAAITTTRWQDGMTVNRAGIVDRLPQNAGADAFGAVGLAPESAPWHLDRLVHEQAVMLATNDTYYMFAAIVMLGAVVIWFAPRAQSRAKAA